MPKRRPHSIDSNEPALAELLDDPVLQAMLRRDHVSREDLLAVIAGARARLGLCDRCPH